MGGNACRVEPESVRLHDIEPAYENAMVTLIPELMQRLLPPVHRRDRPILLAIDGRSANGKTTLAQRIARAVPGCSIVHTDDIAWWHSRFGWDDLLIEGIIEPLLSGHNISYQPPAWSARGRTGAIDIPAAADVVIVEGVGAGRSSLVPWLDAVIWVQSDLDVSEHRDAARVEAGEVDLQGYHDWMAEEVPFLAAERTWERADVVVSGSSHIAHNPDSEVIVLTH